MQMTLSVAIITRDEEANLGRTLASVRWANELIVVDSGSTDRTVEIATSFPNTKVFCEPWKGFSSQKNSAIDKCTSDWILSLDADEEVSQELQIEIRTLLTGDPPADAYLLRRRNLFLNRWIRFGGYYPDPKLRLFRRNSANFASAARFSERPVHETITFQGKLDTLRHDLIHHAYPDLESYLEHMDRYSTLGAEILVSKHRVSRSIFSFYWNVFLVPILTFLWNYLFRLGFLDGREGLLLHLYHSTYVSWKYAKAWQTIRAPRPTYAPRDLSGTRPAMRTVSPAPTPITNPTPAPTPVHTHSEAKS
jgi:glycosyltransferase involved in cell wall biosynthesis